MPYRIHRLTWIRGTLRWLLQTSRPVPARSDEEVAADVERNYRWNFSVNLLDNAGFMFGFSFISATTIVPLFISKLTASPLPIGIAAVIAQSGWSLPQIFTANSVERLARKKPVAVNLGFFLERLPLWLLVFAPMIAVRAPTPALVLFLVTFAWITTWATGKCGLWTESILRLIKVRYWVLPEKAGAANQLWGWLF